MIGRSQEEIANILQVCLDMVERGQETVESAAALYPDIEDILRAELGSAVWFKSFKKELEPSPEFITASRNRLVAKIKQETAVSRREKAPARASLPPWQLWFRKLMLPAAIAAVLLFALFTGGTGVVLAAQNALPGDQLYPVKITIEQVTLAVTLDETQNAQLSLEFTQRRLTETKRLIAAQRYDQVDNSIANFENQLNHTIQTLNVVAGKNSQEAQKLAASLEFILMDQNRVLSHLAEETSSPSKPAIERMIRASQNGARMARQIAHQPTATPTLMAGGFPGASATPLQPNEPTQTSTASSPVFPTDTPTEPGLRTPAPTPTVEVVNTRPAKPTSTSTPWFYATPTSAPTETDIPPTDVPTWTPTEPPTWTPSPAPTDTPEPTDTDTPASQPTSTPDWGLTPTPVATDMPQYQATETVDPGINETAVPFTTTPNLPVDGSSPNSTLPDPLLNFLKQLLQDVIS